MTTTAPAVPSPSRFCCSSNCWEEGIELDELISWWNCGVAGCDVLGIVVVWLSSCAEVLDLLLVWLVVVLLLIFSDDTIEILPVM